MPQGVLALPVWLLPQWVLWRPAQRISAGAALHWNVPTSAPRKKKFLGDEEGKQTVLAPSPCPVSPCI